MFIMNISKNLLILILAGLMLVFALPSPYQLALLCFICIIPLYYVIDKNNSVVKTGFYGLFWGVFVGLFIYYGSIESDITIYLYSLFLAGAEGFYFFYFTKKYSAFSGIMFVILFEFYRNLGSFAFPSNFALCLWKTPYLNNFASIGGIYSVTFFIFITNYILYRIIFKKELKKCLMLFIVWLVFIAPYFINTPDNDEIEVAFVQGNLPENEFDEKIEGGITRYIWGILNYMNLTRKNIDKGYDFIIWSETVFKQDIFNNRGNLLIKEFFDLIDNNNLTLLFGLEYFENNKKFNSLMLYNNKIIDRYDKLRLVPVMEKQFTKGESKKTIIHNNTEIIPFICYESIFNYKYHYSGNPSFGVVSSSDVGYSTLSFNYLHASYTVYRALELGRYFVRVSHTGLSFIVSEKGEIIKQAPFGEVGIWNAKINLKSHNTIYNKFHWYILSLYGFLFVFSLTRKFKKTLNIIGNSVKMIL